MVAANHDKAYNGHPWISINQKVATQRPEKLDTLSQHAPQDICCIKEAAEAQNNRQADTEK